MDGRADDLRGQRSGAGARHGVLHPHDPAEQPHRAQHVPGGDVDRHEAGRRAGDACAARAGGELTGEESLSSRQSDGRVQLRGAPMAAARRTLCTLARLPRWAPSSA